MDFRGIGAQGNYARAGQAVANDAVKSFAAARRNSPNFGKMVQEASNIRTKEKEAMNELGSQVAARGIQAKAGVKANEITTDAESNLRSAKRKAGVLAAGGKFFGQAATYMGEKRNRRVVGESDSFYDTMIERNDARGARQTALIQSLKGKRNGGNSSDSSSSSTSSPSSSSSTTTAAPSSGDQWNRWGKVISFAEGTSGKDGYTTMFGGRQFTDMSRHPNSPMATSWGTQSEAAGKYQFMKPTWDSASSAVGVTDFSPESQEKVGRYLAEQRGLDINAQITNIDEFRAQVDKIAPEWAGLPYSGKGRNGGGYGTSYYGQGGKSIEQLWEIWNGGL